MGTNKKNQTPAKAKKPLKRPEKRVLVRWNDELDKRLLLCIQSACNTQGLRVPWEKVADLMGPSVSEGAIIQHLAKLRNRTTDFKLPPLRRGGAPSQYAKFSETANDSGKRATRTRKRAGDEEDYVDDDVLNDVGDDEYDSEFIDDYEVDNGHVVKRAKTIGGTRRAKNVSSKANRSNTSENGPENEYIEAASGVWDNVSEGVPKNNEDDRKSSSQGSPIGLGAEFLKFTNSLAGSKEGTESLKSFDMGEYTEGSKVVKLPVPGMGGRYPEEITLENAGEGKVGGIFEGEAGQKGCRNNGNEGIIRNAVHQLGALQGQHGATTTNGNEGIIRGAVNQLGAPHGQHGATTSNNYGPQVVKGPSTEYTPYHFQGMNMGGNSAFVEATNALGPPAPRNMPYPHHTQYGMNTSGNDAFVPFAPSSNTTYGQQYGMNIGSSRDGIQGIQGIHGSTSQASYGPQAIGTNMRDDAVWAPATSGLGNLNAYSPLSNSFFSDATHTMNTMATTDSINPNILDSSSFSLDQGGYAQSSLQDTLSDFGFDGMHSYAPSPRQLSSGANNTQSIPDFDKYLDEFSNFL